MQKIQGKRKNQFWFSAINNENVLLDYDVSKFARENDIDKHNISKALSKKGRTSAGNYIFNHIFLLYSGLDMIEFSSEKFHYIDFEEEKKEARNIDKHVEVTIKDSVFQLAPFSTDQDSRYYDYILEDKGFRYQIRCRQRSNHKIISIKFHGRVFYTNSIETILDDVESICRCFDIKLKNLKLSKFDYAIDVKLNYKFLEKLKEEDFKGGNGRAKINKIIDMKNKKPTFFYYTQNLGLIVYDKILESIQHKKTYFTDMYNINDKKRYLSADFEIIRFEYRIRRKVISRYQHDFNDLYNINFYKSIIKDVSQKNIQLKTQEMELLRDCLKSDFKIQKKPNIINEIEYMAEVSEAIVAGHIASYLAKLQRIDMKLYNIDEMLEKIKNLLMNNLIYTKIDNADEKLKKIFGSIQLENNFNKDFYSQKRFEEEQKLF